MDSDSSIESQTHKVSLLLREGREYSIHGNDLKAREFYKQAELFCRVTKDNLGLGNALLGKGFLDALSNDCAKAKQAYEEALALFQVNGNRIQEANARMALGHLHEGLSNKNDAGQYFKQAATIFQDLGQLQYAEFAQSALRRVGA